MVGDSAIRIDFGELIDPQVNIRVLAVAAAVREMGPDGVRDIVPSYTAATIYIDPLIADVDGIWKLLERLAAAPVNSHTSSRDVLVPVHYGGSDGPDLQAVASFANCSVDQVIHLHTAPRYRVYMVGFLPGFPYLGPVDSRIAIPRLANPRLAVPAGIYPTVAPGGWCLIGRTSVKVFDSDRDPPSLFRPGDFVRFEAVAGSTR